MASTIWIGDRSFWQHADGSLHLICGRCGGSGNIPSYRHVYAGECFGCNGSGRGKFFESVEKAEKAEAARLKAKDRADAKRAEKAKVALAAQLERDHAYALRLHERREAEIAAKASGEIQPVPVTSERIQITGRVISQRTDYAYFGGREKTVYKVLVLDDRGFKLWGTEPSSLELTSDAAREQVRVTFQARIERSPDDQYFGFFSRPTKAEVVS